MSRSQPGLEVASGCSGVTCRHSSEAEQGYPAEGVRSLCLFAEGLELCVKERE